MVANADLLKTSVFYLFLIKSIYRNPLHNDWDYVTWHNIATVKIHFKKWRLKTGLSLKKTLHMWLPHTKTTFNCFDKCFWIAHHNIMTCDLCETKYWYENNTVINSDIESQKTSSMFPYLQNWCLRGSYTVYKEVLESRQALRTFKLI